MKLERPDFSIVIVNWNESSYLRACLRSLCHGQEGVSQQVIVVDNGSTDDSLAVAQQEMPGLLLLAQSHNLGYVPANNIGMAAATGRYMMYLNNDAELRPGALRVLRDFLDAHPQAAAASARILNPDGSDQGVARRFPSVMNGLFGRRAWLTHCFPNNRWSRRYMVGSHHASDEAVEVEILSAASLVVRTDLAKALGGMDEAFTLYWVDAELLGRMRRLGHSVWLVPQAQVMHHEGKGGSTRSFKQRCRMTLAFHRDAYLAYIKVLQLSRLHPQRWFAWTALASRSLALMALQLLRPQRATSSGVRSKR